MAGISSNPNTLLNFFFSNVKNGVSFDLWINACRNIIDTDLTYLIIDHILRHNLFSNKVINIANPENHPVKKIITEIENFLSIKSNYIEIDKGTCFEINTSLIHPIIEELGISFDPKYLSNLLNQY